jgi:homoserine kinase
MQVEMTLRPDDVDGMVRDIGNTDLLGGANLVIEAMQVTAQRLGMRLPACDIQVASDIPVARGLGSSAAAIVGGVRAALFALEQPADRATIVDIAGAMEGHADNASASEMGGITVALSTAGGYVAESLATDLPWSAVVYIPDSPSLTHEARGVLPAAVPLGDAAANAGRAAMLALALREGRDDLLREAMVDRLHQPYRASIFPHLKPTIAAALDAGALGACLSGAGPTILALAHHADAATVAAAMQAAAARQGMEGQARELSVAQGATTRQQS